MARSPRRGPEPGKAKGETEVRGPEPPSTTKAPDDDLPKPPPQSDEAGPQAPPAKKD